MPENGLIRKPRLSQIGKQIVTIYTLPNVSKNKDNQTMKFGRIMEVMDNGNEKLFSKIR